MMQANQENKTMAPQGIHEPGTGLANPEVKEAAKGTGQVWKQKLKTPRANLLPTPPKHSRDLKPPWPCLASLSHHSGCSTKGTNPDALIILF
jgi:hypothetical protein